MAEMNGLWTTFLNCAGLTVVGVGLLMFALAAISTCLSVVLCAVQPKPSPVLKRGQHPEESKVDLLRLVTGF